NWWEILENLDGGYSYVYDLEDNEQSWRDGGHGRDRIEKWEKSKG
ncbi:MAG: hypothetical protein HQ503_07925, partial [Rhodospirillales bacterium]|nr:hypothetical protein [Rhodospirillales bacterium]